ncbi:MAG: hypothetical protein WCD25_27290, partial [Pseudolabrys sp.]
KNSYFYAISRAFIYHARSALIYYALVGAGASQTFGMAEHFTGLRFGSMDDSLCSGELSTVKLRNDSAARESGMRGVFG